MENLFTQGELRDITGKVLRGERLNREDGLRLMRSKDLLTIGYLADLVRRRKHGDRAYFIVNRHINQTNICVNRCRFCAFGKDPGAPGSYALTLDEIVEQARRSWALGISEVHIVGGLHPDLSLEYYTEMMRRLREALPGVVIQALTAVEVEYLAQRHQMTVEDVLLTLHQAGLDSLPGGGAEVFSPRVREQLCPKKISGERWLHVHETAHRLGIRTNATMLYGHIETPEERVDHLLALRALQDRTGGFLAFVPLAFHPGRTELEGVVRNRTTGYDDLRMLAVSRLMLDNFDHIKAYWIMIGEKISQVALSFGADDLDGTVVEERITHAAGAETAQSLTRRELIRQIRAAGRRPVERDTLYNVIREEF